ncbi:MAG: hypothetical protein ACC662_05545 [Planctomycetota bacterium]
MRIATLTVALVALTQVLGFAPARGGDDAGFHLETRVPASTLAFVSLEDVGTWPDRLGRTGLGRLFQDEEMQAFFAPLAKMASEAIGGKIRGLPPLAVETLEQLQGLEGQLALALVDVDPEGESAQVVLSLDFDGNVGDFTAFLERIRKKVDPQGEKIRTAMRDGRTWWTVTGGEMPLYVTTVGTAVVAATDAALLDGIVANEGLTGALADNPDFRAVRSKAGGRDLAIFAFGNVASALEKFGSQMGAQALTIANALGLDTLRGLGYGLAIRGGDFRDTLIVHAPKADHGLIPLMAMPPLTAPRTLDLVPSGAFYWAEANLPVSTLLPRVRLLVQAIDPEAVGQMGEGLATVKQMLGVDLETELLGGLDDGMGLYAAFPPTGGLYPELAWILQVKDPGTYEGIFDRFVTGLAGILTEQGGVTASTRVIDYHGTRLHVVDLQASRGDDVVPFTPTWALIGSRLVVTLVPHAMKEIVLRAQGRTSAPGLASKPDFQALIREKPLGAGAMAYVDLKGALSLVYDTLVPLLQTAAKPNVMKDVKVPLDWAMLPPASRVAPYFSSLAEYVTWNEDGIHVSYQGPIPVLSVALLAGAASAILVTRSESSPSVGVAFAEPGGKEVGEDLDAEMDVEVAKLQAEILADYVSTFRKNYNRLPNSLKEIVEAEIMKAPSPDPWDGAYRLVVQATGGYAVVSPGPDRKIGTADDVTVKRN